MAIEGTNRGCRDGVSTAKATPQSRRPAGEAQRVEDRYCGGLELRDDGTRQKYRADISYHCGHLQQGKESACARAKRP